MLATAAVNEVRRHFTDQVYIKLASRSGSNGLSVSSSQALHDWWLDPRPTSQCLELNNVGLGIAHPIMPSWVFNLNIELPYNLALQKGLSRLTCPYYAVYSGDRGKTGLKGIILFGEEEATWLSLYGIDELQNYLKSL